MTTNNNVKLYDKDAPLEPITLSRNERNTIVYLLREVNISKLEDVIVASTVCEKLEALRG